MLTFLFLSFSFPKSFASEGIWATDFYQAGNAQYIHALAIGSEGSIYCGGDFQNFANHRGTALLARWNGANWIDLDGGILGTRVYAILPVGSDLYVGGLFTQAGSITATNLARWDGKNWHAVGGGVSGVVRALAWKDGSLYVGGNFTNAGTVPASNIAKWDGGTWDTLSGGVQGKMDYPMPNAEPVSALQFIGNELYAGGTLTNASGTDVRGVARWDGAKWNAVGDIVTNSLDGGVLALANDAVGNLYAAGWFSQAGTNKSEMIARWDGFSWSSLGQGLPRNSDNYLAALYCDGTNIYAGGNILGLEKVLRWDGINWALLPSLTDGGTLCITGAGNQIYASGLLTSPTETHANGIVHFDGTNWSTMGAGFLAYYKGSINADASVNAITPFKNRIIAGGRFAAEKIAAWDGRNWASMVQPVRTVNVSAQYSALVADTENLFASGPPIIDEKPLNYIARYDGTNWFGLGGGLSAPAKALALRGRDLFAGTQQGVVRWDGIAWSSVQGLIGSVATMALDDTHLYAGGQFTDSAGGSLNHIARWDGEAWERLEDGVDGIVNAMVLFNKKLIVGGDFGRAGTQPADHLAVWDGSSWSPVDTRNLGPPGSVAAVNVLVAAPDGTIYAGGRFGTNGLAILRNDVLLPFPKGDTEFPDCVGPTVYALALKDADLYVGGDFTGFDRDNLNLRFARWHIATPALYPSGVAPRTVSNKGPIEYSIRIFNGATYAVSNSTVSARVPVGTSFLSADSDGSLSGEIVTWHLPSLPAQQVYHLSFTVQANASRSTVSLDEFGITDSIGKLYRGSALFTTALPLASVPELSFSSLVFETEVARVQLRVMLPAANPAQDIHLQFSPDLTTWLELASAPLTNSILQFSDQAAVHRGFYRALLTTPP